MKTWSDMAAGEHPPQEVLELARVLWEFLRVGDALEKSDVILVLGSSDMRSAEWGARLWLDGYAPLLAFTGGRGRLTRHWELPEGEVFARTARQMGVPGDRILVESRSGNTGENVRFTRSLFARKGLDPERWILVHTPPMERRARATFVHHWPGKKVLVTSVPLSLEDFPTPALPLDFVIKRLAGEIHRLLEYPRRGFQAQEDVPPHVLDAWRSLVDRGYDGHVAPAG